MVFYYKHHVSLFEPVYDFLSPFTVSKLNFNLFSDTPVCSLCGSGNITKEKKRPTRVSLMQQVRCKDCGHYSSYPVSKTGKEGLIR